MKTQGNTRKQRGQGMTEYVIIVALIAVAAIGVYSLFGRTVRNQTAGLAQEVAGVSAGTAIQAGNCGMATVPGRRVSAKNLGRMMPFPLATSMTFCPACSKAGNGSTTPWDAARNLIAGSWGG